MFVKSSLCLLAAVLSVPASATVDIPSWAQPAIDSGLALAGLNGIAVLKALGNIKGTCNAANLKVRQEWYVSDFAFSSQSASYSYEKQKQKTA